LLVVPKLPYVSPSGEKDGENGPESRRFLLPFS